MREVVQRIVSTLVGRVRAADAERARRKPPASLAAYECMLHGNALPWSDPAGAAAATRLFDQALELDPDEKVNTFTPDRMPTSEFVTFVDGLKP